MPTLTAPDLRKSFPRSPGATLGLYILLPRIIDKCRAVVAETNGEYKFNCPLDQRFFDFTGIDAEAFRSEIEKGKSDEEILSWVQANSKVQDENVILEWVYDNRTRRPEGEYKAYYEKMRFECAPDNPYVETWFQLLDAEEGRFKI